MTVSLAGALPKDDLNGLASAERRLLSEHEDGSRYLVIGVLETTSIKGKAPSWRIEPTVSLTHIEIVSAELADTVAAQLMRLYQERTGRVGLFGDDSEVQAPLELTEQGGYLFKVIREEDGSFSIELISRSSGQAIGSRHALRGEEFDGLEFAVGAFDLGKLPVALMPAAKALLAEWGIDADPEDGVVDAEVVDGGDDE